MTVHQIPTAGFRPIKRDVPFMVPDHTAPCGWRSNPERTAIFEAEEAFADSIRDAYENNAALEAEIASDLRELKAIAESMVAAHTLRRDAHKRLNGAADVVTSFANNAHRRARGIYHIKSAIDTELDYADAYSAEAIEVIRAHVGGLLNGSGVQG